MKQALFALCFASALLAQTATKSTAPAPSAAKSTASPSPAVKSAIAPVAKAPAATVGDLLHPSTLTASAPASYRVKLATTKGDIVIEVTRAWAPRGADRFYNLVRAGYFTDCVFYRVMPKFMAQFGVSARPDVNRAFKGADILDDPHSGHSNTRGKLTFATTSAPNSRGTALFINLVDNAYLDSGFVPIGEVIEGMENADMLYNGYGDTSSKQGSFENGGKAFVDGNYPKLDRILTATVVPAAPAAAPAGPSAAPKGTTASKSTTGPKT
jgi:peptidyl-prolyl cis-trans isomerase A (cyclophilin A)